MPVDTDLLLSNREYVLRTVEERSVRFVRLWFVDVLGMLKSFAIPVTELETALEDGVGLDRSALEGSARLAERDVIAYPDPRPFSCCHGGRGRWSRECCAMFAFPTGRRSPATLAMPCGGCSDRRRTSA
jgi:glutamine synthetase